MRSAYQWCGIAQRALHGVALAAPVLEAPDHLLHAEAERGWLDGERAMLESLLGIRRAGADVIITYFATDAATALAR